MRTGASLRSCSGWKPLADQMVALALAQAVLLPVSQIV